MVLQNPLPITPLPGPFELNVDFLPGSKSLTNRALLLAALADGISTLTNVLFADDTRRMMEALQTLGFQLDIDELAKIVTVHGRGGKIPAKNADLFLGNAGTAMRFLTAAVCLGDPGSVYTLRGIPRMHQRPIGQLVDPLRQLGAKIEYLENEGYPPLRIAAGGLAGGRCRLPAVVSSQFVSALLQIGPYCSNGICLDFSEPVLSFPYIHMTLNLLTRFGADVPFYKYPCDSLAVNSKSLSKVNWGIEPDASNASYFLAIAALCPSRKLEIEGLTVNDSVQGDVWFASMCLEKMGCKHIPEVDSVSIIGPTKLHGINESLNDMPDMAQTLAVVALFADGPTVIRNVGNLRLKETDRIAALQNELTKLGATVTVAGDDITIVPPADNILRHPDGTVIDDAHPVVIDTYDDHRMAMSFAVAGLRQAGIRIADPACVNKTYPEFFDHLGRLHRAAQKGAAR